MALKKRIQTMQDVGQLKGILKTHVHVCPTACQSLWQYKCLEEVAENYVDFLTAVAMTSSLLSKQPLSKALKAMYDGDTALLDAFAQAMVDALKGCRIKLPMLRTGVKTCNAVRKVCEAWTTTAGSSCSLEESEVQELEGWSPAQQAESEVVTVWDVDEAAKAKEALVKTMALFPVATPELMQRKIGQRRFYLSNGSSEPTSPKTTSEDAMLDIKARHPLSTLGFFMYRGRVVLESWLRGSALIRAVNACTCMHWFYRGYPPLKVSTPH
jgi:hypothetical protein